MSSSVNKGGRPTKYQDEKAVRLTVMIRPRYRQMIDHIAELRKCTLSEAVELCVAQIANTIEIGDRSIYDIVVTEDEFEIGLREASFSKKRSLPDPELEKAIKTFKVNQAHYENLPTELKSPKLDFYYRIGKAIGPRIWEYFDKEKMTYFLEEQWKIGIDESYIIEKINEFIEI